MTAPVVLVDRYVYVVAIRKRLDSHGVGRGPIIELDLDIVIRRDLETRTIDTAQPSPINALLNLELTQTTIRPDARVSWHFFTASRISSQTVLPTPAERHLRWFLR